MDIETLDKKELLIEKYHQDKEEWKNSKSYQLILEHVGIPLVRPSGFRLLIKIFGIEKKSEARKSSIILPDSMKDKDLWNSRLGLVLAMGPEAYDPHRFPYGPYCDVGEYIYFTRHDSSLCRINGHNMAILNDDKCLTVVNDPLTFENELQMGV